MVTGGKRVGRPKGSGRAAGDNSTRERILAAALGLFAGRGFEGSGIGDIAAQVGIARSVIYHHFADKDAVLAEIARRTIDSVIELKRGLAASLGAAGGSRDFAPIVTALVSFVLANRNAMIVLLRESLRGRPDAPIFDFWEANVKAGRDLARDFGLEAGSDPSDGAFFEAFFLLVMPMVGFAVLADPWVRRFGGDHRGARTAFERAFCRSLEQVWKKR